MLAPETLHVEESVVGVSFPGEAVQFSVFLQFLIVVALQMSGKQTAIRLKIEGQVIFVIDFEFRMLRERKHTADRECVLADFFEAAVVIELAAGVGCQKKRRDQAGKAGKLKGL
jgi:hypothetical protein